MCSQDHSDFPFQIDIIGDLQVKALLVIKRFLSSPIDLGGPTSLLLLKRPPLGVPPTGMSPPLSLNLPIPFEIVTDFFSRTYEEF